MLMALIIQREGVVPKAQYLTAGAKRGSDVCPVLRFRLLFFFEIRGACVDPRALPLITSCCDREKSATKSQFAFTDAASYSSVLPYHGY